MNAKKLLAQGVFPVTKKQRIKDHFSDWLEKWLKEDSTRNIVEGVIKRDVLPKFNKKARNEITADMLRSHCEKIKDRGTSASAVRTRDIVGSVFNYAKARGINCENPAEYVAPQR